MSTNKKSILTPNKRECSFGLTSSIDGRKTLNHLTKTKKKRMHAAIGKVKGAQTSRNMSKINGVSSRISTVSKTNTRHKYINKMASRKDRTLESLGALSSRILNNYEQEYPM